MGPELLLLLAVFVIVFVWRGPGMLPRIGEALGKTIRGVRDEVPSALKDEGSKPSESADPDKKGDS